jgi:hypothetical protein
MKTEFITITDISEIDTSKATVYDLNKRFIDPRGNMYGLKYNRSIKKIEVIRLMRTAAKNEAYFTQKMILNQRNSSSKPEDQATDHSNQFKIPPVEGPLGDFSVDEGDIGEIIEQEPGSNFVSNAADTEKFEPDIFIDETLKTVATHKERLSGIALNINNAKIYNYDDRELSGKLDDLLRNLSIDGEQRIDKFNNYYRELKEYPRSIQFYFTRMDPKLQDIINKLTSDGAKMRFIYLIETHNNFQSLYKSLQKSLKDLLAHLLGLSSDHLSILNQLEKQHLEDAKITIENTLTEIRDLLIRFNEFYDFIFTSHVR